jgi:hypothetical protein
MIIGRSGRGGGVGRAPLTLSASDSNGNPYQTVVSESVQGSMSPYFESCYQTILIATNCIGGANTVSFTFSGVHDGGDSRDIYILEFNPFAAGSGVPFFRPPLSSDIPSLDASKITSGVIGVTNGGTGANLSGTGGVHQVLKQASTGAAVTVGTIDYNDIAGVNVAGRYNGDFLVGLGLPSEVASADAVSQTADIGLTTIFIAEASFIYRVSVYIIETQAASVSSTLPDVTIQWTDQDNNTVQTSVPIVAVAPSGNTLTTMAQGTVFIRARIGQAIKYQTGANTPYASSGSPVMNFALHIRVEAL